MVDCQANPVYRPAMQVVILCGGQGARLRKKTKSRPKSVVSISDDCVRVREPLERLANEGQPKAHSHFGFWQYMDTQRAQQQHETLWASVNAPWKIW